MIKNPLLICAALICLNSAAQQATLSDVKTFGAAGNQTLHDMAKDPQGNMLLCGRYESGNPNDFDPSAEVDTLPTDISYNAFISKWTAEGDYLWSVALQGSGNSWDEAFSIASDNDGNVLVTGVFNGTLDFDPGPDEYLITANSSSFVMFVLKLSPEGTFEWAFSVDAGIFYPTSGEAITTDSENNVIIGGGFSLVADFDPSDGTTMAGSVGLYDLCIAKYTPDGEFLWVKSFGSTATDFLYDLAVDAEDNIYSTGYLGGSADVDTDLTELIHTNLGSYDAFIHKLDPSGAFISYTSIAGSGSEVGLGMAISGDGLIDVTGYCTSDVDLDPGVGEEILISAGGGWQTAFVIQYNADMTINWYQSLPVISEGNNVVFDDYNNTIMTGYFNGTVDLDAGPGNTTVVSNGGPDVFLMKLSVDGEFLTGAGFGSLADDRGVGVLVNENNQSVVAGTFGGDVDFDPTPLVVSVISDQTDIFVSTLNTCLDEAIITNETACESFTWNGETYTESGTYDLHFLNSVGCDSMLVLNLAITGSYETTLTETACESYTWYDQTYSETGVYTHQLQSAAGCDSTLVLNLTITVPAETYLEQTACESYTLNDTTYFSSGVYTQILQTINGCDSIVVLDLSIPVISEEVTVNGSVITAIQEDASYQWVNCSLKGAIIEGETGMSYAPDVTGVYAVMIEVDNCETMSECVDVIVDNVNESSLNRLQVYPNPTNGRFRINGLNVASTNVVLRSMADGKVVFTKRVATNEWIDLSEMSAGTYLLEMATGSEFQRELLILTK